MEQAPYQPARQRVRYRGRFAPTPSGPLHLGSLFTALACYLQAKLQGGDWLLRIDDLDTARNAPGASDTILRQLEAHALHWDGTPYYQSQHVEVYAQALSRLRAAGQVYPCSCTRQQLRQTGLPGPDDRVYAGTCRDNPPGSGAYALRLRTGSGTLHCDDPWQGPQQREISSQIGDFVLWRADGQPSYQLACAVDELTLGITEVVRGADLIGSTFRQLRLQQLLGLQSPAYRHLPVLQDRSGLKLSKQNHALALERAQAGDNLLHCLRLLGQQPPQSLQGAAPPAIVDWARGHWQPAAVPAHSGIALE